MTRIMRAGVAGVAFASVFTAAATAKGIDTKLEQAVRIKAAETLIDPYSAVFTFQVVKELADGNAGKLCGSVNAKNHFGAYTGQRFFYAGYLKTQTGYVIIAFSIVNMPFNDVMAQGDICS